MAKLTMAEAHRQAERGYEWGEATNRELAQALIKSQNLLRRIEWIRQSSEWGSWSECPACEATEEFGHKDDCELAAALLEEGSDAH